MAGRKISSMDEELGAQLSREFDQLYSLRGNLNSHLTEIAQRVMPSHSFLFQTGAQQLTKGEKRTFELFDSTAAVSLGRFAAICDSLLTARNSVWHRIRPSDDALLHDKATRNWFDDVNDILFRERYAPAANFASQNQQQYMSLGAYGTGGLFIDRLQGQRGIRYKNIHLGELYIRENHQGIVDSCFRRYAMTARQVIQKFKDNTPEFIFTEAAKNPDTEFFFVHVVKPNEDRDPERLDFQGMPHLSFYVCLQDKSICSRGGFNSYPYAVSRYFQEPNETYGRSPAMEVLPAIKTLNEQKKTLLKQGHRAVDPVLLAHDDGIVDGMNLTPGAVNYGGVSKDGRPLVTTLPVGSVQIGKEMMDDERDLIKDTFLVSLFQILTESPEMTATEVMERVREKGILLAPTVGRQQSEYLGPLIDRELDLLSQMNMLPPMPGMLKEAKGQYKVVYDSPISRAARAEEATGAMRTIEMLMQYATNTQDPSVLDIINMDVAGPEIADIQGTPSRWVRTMEERNAIREQRSQQMRAQQMIQAAPAAAAMIKATKA